MPANQSTPVLRHVANPWSLVEYPSAPQEWSFDRKMQAVKEAGFDAVTVTNAEQGAAAKKCDLITLGYVSSGKLSELRPLLQQCKDGGAVHINVQLADEDTLTPEALGLTIKLFEIACDLGVKPAIEIHRDTCTETPEKSYALADAYHKVTGELMPMTWDFSHFAVVKHLWDPAKFSERLLLRPDLIQHAQQFHFRPFNGHHCQVPVTDGKGNLSQEVKNWMPVAENTLKMWLAGPRPGNEIFVTPEMGPIPGGYNLSTLPNSWEDAQVLRVEIDKIWKKLIQ